MYVFPVKTPESRVAVIKSLTEMDKVESVRLLGAGEVKATQSFGVLTVKLPEDMPTEYTNCLAITLSE